MSVQQTGYQGNEIVLNEIFHAPLSAVNQNQTGNGAFYSERYN